MKNKKTYKTKHDVTLFNIDIKKQVCNWDIKITMIKRKSILYILKRKTKNKSIFVQIQVDIQIKTFQVHRQTTNIFSMKTK